MTLAFPPAPIKYVRDTWQNILEKLRVADNENLKNNRNIRLNSGVVIYIRQPNGTEVPLVIDNNGAWGTPNVFQPLTTKLSATYDTTIPAGYGSYLPDLYEIGNGFFVEVADTAVMEIG